MRKQYRIENISFMKNRVYIYQDGKLIDSQSFWLDEVNNEIERLESVGYTQGYIKAEVEAARLEYEYRLENAI